MRLVSLVEPIDCLINWKFGGADETRIGVVVLVTKSHRHVTNVFAIGFWRLDLLGGGSDGLRKWRHWLISVRAIVELYWCVYLGSLPWLVKDQLLLPVWMPLFFLVFARVGSNFMVHWGIILLVSVLPVALTLGMLRLRSFESLMRRWNYAIKQPILFRIWYNAHRVSWVAAWTLFFDHFVLGLWRFKRGHLLLPSCLPTTASVGLGTLIVPLQVIKDCNGFDFSCPRQSFQL